MREILFRGKLIDNGDWVEGSLVKSTYVTPTRKEEHFRIQETVYGFNDESEMPYFCDYMSGIDEAVIPETICEYTGKKDKNGNRIFEGDIVRFSDKDWTESGIATVDFESGKWKINGRYTTKISAIVWLDLYRMGFEYEVIGNKWDNPELLEVE